MRNEGHVFSLSKGLLAKERRMHKEPLVAL
jgi:hypothetical protein